MHGPENLGHVFDTVLTAARYVAANACPGWKETNYEAALVAELSATQGSLISVQQQVTLRSYFKTSNGIAVETGALRPDLRVECRCLDCDVENVDNNVCYVEIKLDSRCTLQQAHIEQAKGYAAAATGWEKQDVACLAIAFTGRSTILYDAFIGADGRSVKTLTT